MVVHRWVKQTKGKRQNQVHDLVLEDVRLQNLGVFSIAFVVFVSPFAAGHVSCEKQNLSQELD